MFTIAMLFLIYTLIMWFAGNCILKIFQQMTADGGALDVVFGWQKMLAKLYSGGKWAQLLGKALGDCPVCTAFWFMPFWFVVYYFMAPIFVEWPITGGWNIVWYFVFHSIGAVVGGIVLLVKLRKK